MSQTARGMPTADEPGTAFRVTGGGHYARAVPITDAQRARHERLQESAAIARMNAAAKEFWRR